MGNHWLDLCYLDEHPVLKWGRSDFDRYGLPVTSRCYEFIRGQYLQTHDEIMCALTVEIGQYDFMVTSKRTVLQLSTHFLDGYFSNKVVADYSEGDSAHLHVYGHKDVQDFEIFVGRDHEKPILTRKFLLYGFPW